VSSKWFLSKTWPRPFYVLFRVEEGDALLTMDPIAADFKSDKHWNVGA